MKRKDSTFHSLSVLTVGVVGLLDYFMAFMKIKDYMCIHFMRRLFCQIQHYV